MGEIRDYKCTYTNSAGVRWEVTKKTGMRFPEAYYDREGMKALAKAVKEADGAAFCLLPFCRTVEAEALGASINPGDENSGPRGGEPVLRTPEDLKQIGELDLNRGRIHETLEACRELKEEGETVALELTGPFTALSVLADPKLLFKEYRKHREETAEVLRHYGEQSLRFAKAAKECGADILIYSDSAGSLPILGPRVMTKAVEDFYVWYLPRLAELADERLIISLCPKMAYAAVDTGHARITEHPTAPGISYLEALLAMRGRAKIGGQSCPKTVGSKVKDGIFRELVLE